MTIRDIELLAALAVCAGCNSPQEPGAEAGPSISATGVGGAASSMAFTSLESCAASGCHGQAFDGLERNWQTAYSIWRHEDPHRRAFEVLYAERSLEMYRNLHPEKKRAADPPEDEAYFQFLGQRCIGCHATPQNGDSAVAAAGSQARPDDYLAGISCQSCHGPAGGWLDEHYLTSWPEPGSAGRSSLAAKGFRDTADLRTRAAVCVGCHVGPQTGHGRLYEVDHDLIAAGHPRLSFELGAYLENYPQHWDQRSDAARYLAKSGGSFHLDVWRFGQEQTALQLVRRIGLRLAEREDSSGTAWLDFSSYECFDCHHALGAHAGSGLLARGGSPRPALGSLEILLAQHNLSGEPSGAAAKDRAKAIDRLRFGLADWSAGRLRAADVAAAQEALEATPLPAWPASDRALHVQYLFALLDQWQPAHHEPGGAARQPHEISWDQAVQFYLAVQALVRDLPPTARPRRILAEANEQLHSALAGAANFGQRVDGRGVTQYDSPATFDAAAIADELAAVRAALEAIQTAFPGPTP